ncbi:MAG: hypothetical protein ACRCYO_00970 [Bacteroidia bacterium]
MKHIFYTAFAAILLASCSSSNSEAEAYFKKQAQTDSLNSVIANDHKKKILELRDFVSNDTTIWSDTVCEISDKKMAKLSFMIYNMIDLKVDSTDTEEALDRLMAMQNMNELNTSGYVSDEMYALAELGRWVNYNKKNNSPYIIFVQSLASSMPKMGEDKASFDAGYFIGRAFIVNYETKQMMCSFGIFAESSETVEYRTGGTYSSDATYKLQQDMMTNIKNEIRSRLKIKTSCPEIMIAGFDGLYE